MMELLSKPAARLIGAAILVIAVLLAAWLALHEIRGMIADAVQLSVSERDSYWTAKIEKANADTNKRAADQAAAVVKIQADMADKSRADQTELAALKVKNAELPHRNNCGLSGERVGLLPN
ncbi:hypothetical protein [Rhizobium leguminosarum]|uniref:hypothetical protein n=1 Tax=Rhizobium leguminosarum TaxID=384 RepID=UPI00140FAEE0|nr:hypothetical protein [Rhizobium leguminosarum]QIO60675.1 hypothetical protein HA463_24460 [Rhizobium leguminosarum bv. trifolii]